MTYIAFAYPNQCEFIRLDNASLFYGRDISTYANPKPFTETRIVVDCDRITLCWFFDMACTKGSREYFSILAHATPIIVGAVLHSTLQKLVPDLELRAQLLDIVDIQ